MGVNLRAVAKRAGVRVATASRVLNGHPQVSEETRRKVLAAAEQLGYKVEDARPRRHLTHRVISLIVPDVSSPFYCAILQGVEREAFSQQFDLVLYTTEGRSQVNVVERVASAKTISGVIVVTPRHGEDRYLREIGAQLPVVVVDHRAEGSGFPHVTVDNLRAGFQATSYLIAQGHRRIGFVSGPLNIESARDRLRGYRLALDEANIPFDEQLVLEGDFEQPTGYRLLKEWIAANPQPDAWFCSNDLMAAGAIQALVEHGISVPEDVAVMGFDDLSVAQMTQPRLTTMRQPIQEMGTIAIRLLLRLLDGEELDTNRIVLNAELVVRVSA